MSSKFSDLTGMRYGNLLVIERTDDHVCKSGQKKVVWKCQCDCGNIINVKSQLLKSGEKTNCGCIKKPKNKNLDIIIGEKYGMLTPIKEVDSKIYPSGVKNRVWLCKCDCGNFANIAGVLLQNGKTQSCGCLRKKIAKEAHTTHNHSNEKLYDVWCKMKSRCNNVNDKDYCYYGADGIRVCEEWNDSYATFRKWAYENGYEDNIGCMQCTIDRVNVNKGYSPDNCRWVNMFVQANNKRNTTRISYNGESLTISQWARKINIDSETIRQRIYKFNWPIEKALTVPASKHNKLSNL